MPIKPIYEHIFELLDYADAIYERIQPGEFHNGNYFMTLVYIEDVLDKYGRELVKSSADTAGHDGHRLMVEATQRMDLLRGRLRDAMTSYDFNDFLKTRTELMRRDWMRRV